MLSCDERRRQGEKGWCSCEVLPIVDTTIAIRPSSLGVQLQSQVLLLLLPPFLIQSVLLLLLLVQVLLLCVVLCVLKFLPCIGNLPISLAECDPSDEFSTPGGAGGLTPQSFYTLSPPLSKMGLDTTFENFLLP